MNIISKLKKGSFIALISALILSGCSFPTSHSPVEELKQDIKEVSETLENQQFPTETAIISSEDKATETESDIVYEDGSFLEAHFIDVGQGDGALIECDGEYMLIDGGTADQSDKIYSYLQNEGISNLDYLVCTHAHADHVGGLSAPLNTMTVETVFAPVTETDSKAYTNFQKGVANQGLTIVHPNQGDTVSLGNSTVMFLGPVTEDVEDLNNTSIVLRIDHGNNSFLFTGDAEREEEETLLNSGCNLKADVLKVGHHGSESSTTYPFLREVMPTYAVISCGKNNSYGHPDEATLSKLHDAEAQVLRTDEQGDIVIVSDRNNLYVE